MSRTRFRTQMRRWATQPTGTPLRYSTTARTESAGTGCCRTGSARTDSGGLPGRSEEHTSELQSLMRNSYAVFCLKKKTENINTTLSSSYNSITKRSQHISSTLQTHVIMVRFEHILY